MKPAIALLVDVDHWAFATIARQLREHLASRFDIDIIPMSALEEIQREATVRHRSASTSTDQHRAFGQALLLTRDHDLLHVFWRDLLLLLGTRGMNDYAASIGLEPETFERVLVRSRPITTSVYDHLHLGTEAIAARAPMLTETVAAYSVSSRRLERIYRALPVPPPAVVATDGVDLERFSPVDPDHFAGAARERPIVVGWVGNSRWADTDGDHKGLHTIVRPALEQLRAGGEPFELHVADAAETRRLPREMPGYYRSIDVLVCASIDEGTPNPVLEAMASGLPVVTTDVGIVPELLRGEQTELILPERSPEALAAALRRFATSPDALARLGTANRQVAVEWSWARTAQAFGTMWEGVLREGETG